MNISVRRKDRIADANCAEAILSDAEYGTLALCGTGGYPYCVPLNFVKDGNAIYFHCALEGKKLDCIKMSDKAMFCVVGNSAIDAAKFTTRYSSVMVFGKISVCDSPAEKIHALKLLYCSPLRKEFNFESIYSRKGTQ